MSGRSKSILQTGLDILLLVVLAIGSMLAFQDAWHDGLMAKKTGEFITVATIFIYGIAGVVALIGFLSKKNWAWIFVLIWAIFITITAGLATVVYGEQGVGIATVAAVSTLLLFGFPCVYWARKMVKRYSENLARSNP